MGYISLKFLIKEVVVHQVKSSFEASIFLKNYFHVKQDNSKGCFLCAVCFCSFKDSLMNGSLVVSLAQKGEIIQNKNQVHNIGNKTLAPAKIGNLY